VRVRVSPPVPYAGVVKFWQTRRVQAPVGSNPRAGSSPVTCTMEGKPDRRAGPALKAVCTERCGAQDLCFPPTAQKWSQICANSPRKKEVRFARMARTKMELDLRGAKLRENIDGFVPRKKQARFARSPRAKVEPDLRGNGG
jgi:hypothetical protein